MGGCASAQCASANQGTRAYAGVGEQDHWPLPWNSTAGQEYAPLDPCRKSCKKREKAVLQAQIVNWEDTGAAESKSRLL